MKHLILATAFFALVAAPGRCEAQNGGDAAKPLKPGGVRVTTRAPEPDKWNSARSANGTRRIFKCKPLACPDPQTVSFTFLKSPTRKPDPKALEKFAKIDLPKASAPPAQRARFSPTAPKRSKPWCPRPRR